jgi:hypothetical protein
MSEKTIYKVLFWGLIIMIQSCSNPRLTTEPEIVIEDLSGEDIISFEIYFKESEYSMQGDIPVEMRFTNQGSKPIIFNGNFVIIFPNSGENVSIVFTIQDPSGEILPYGFYPHIIRDEPHYFPILEPNGEMIFRAKLNGFYKFIEIGDYTVKAVYNNAMDHPDGRPAWKGTVESSITTIKIKP